MGYILGKINKEKYVVEYKNPELTFLVEISCNIMCLSVLEKFAEYKSYNIHLPIILKKQLLVLFNTEGRYFREIADIEGILPRFRVFNHHHIRVSIIFCYLERNITKVHVYL